MMEHFLHHTLPAAYAVLPVEMQSPRADALLTTIGLQESGFLHRRQIRGPARGFLQFESAGLTGVIRHPSTAGYLVAALRALRYDGPVTSRACLVRVEHNDTLAAVFGRLLLWTLPAVLPAQGDTDEAWRQYREAWRPGRPRPETWAAHYERAWGSVKRAWDAVDRGRREDDLL